MYNRLATSWVAELVGTFALVFLGAGAVALGVVGQLGAAFAHGFVVVGFAYAYGHVSGAHINPAVTLGVLAAGRIGLTRAVAYIVAQCVGGILGALTLRSVLGGPVNGLGATQLASGLPVGGEATIAVSPLAGVAIEAILTFFLVNAVMNAGVEGKVTGPGGLGVGFILTSCILMGGPLTGGSLNPARTLGPAVATGDFTHVWVYFVGPPLGAIAAGLLYRGLFAERLGMTESQSPARM